MCHIDSINMTHHILSMHSYTQYYLTHGTQQPRKGVVVHHPKHNQLAHIITSWLSPRRGSSISRALRGTPQRFNIVKVDKAWRICCVGAHSHIYGLVLHQPIILSENAHTHTLFPLPSSTERPTPGDDFQNLAISRRANIFCPPISPTARGGKAKAKQEQGQIEIEKYCQTPYIL